MKRENGDGGGKKPAKPTRRTKFGGAKPLQISELDGASSLVGSIVEKGISENNLQPPRGSRPPLPQPTALPFPVARHRSHGPYWAPISTDCTGHSVDDAEDEDPMDTVAALANPVRRKEKKGLDFSRWREMIENDKASIPHKSNEEKHVYIGLRDQKKAFNVAETPKALKSPVGTGNDALLQVMSSYLHAQDVTMNESEHAMFEEASSNVIAETKVEITGDMMVDLSEYSKDQRQADDEKGTISTSHIIADNTSTTRTVDESTSLQIDTENRARLQSMSADEIAEAQAEILKKMNPVVVEALRKRGQHKLKIKKDTSSDRAAKREGDVQQDKKKLMRNENGSAYPQSSGDISHKVKTETLSGVNSELNVPAQNLTSVRSTLWDTWSRNVEAVREVRFSLEGNVLNNEFSPLQTGNKSTHSGYNNENVSERDFLRSEGDPAAAGYTIKEAITLSRSVIPSQRGLALHMLGSILDNAIRNICQNQIGHSVKSGPDNFTHWGAVWAYALGPEPELALSLRMSLDDNHNSVVLACAKVIQCILSCVFNESYFDISEKLENYPKEIYTAPVFRSRPEIQDGFLQGGFWKYNAKPSNIIPFGEDHVSNDTERELTIQDDMNVAGQDFVAGLVRMGILPRIGFLLEAKPSVTLEECLIFIVIAIARHSPTCASAILKCERLLQTVVNRFTTNDPLEIHPAKIKSVTLLKVLARSDKKNCIDFIRNGAFRSTTWHLYQCKYSLDQWVKLGSENCKRSSALIVEQLRFWKVCIQYGYCISDFSDFFPALCLWLSVPTIEKLIENNVLSEFTAVTEEIFLVLGALCRRLPNIYSNMHVTNQVLGIAVEDTETWVWAHVGPMVDFAIKWISLMNTSYISKVFEVPMMRVISAVMLMLSSVLDRVIPEDTSIFPGGHLPWLPEFVPKIGLEIMKNGYLSSQRTNTIGHRTDPSQASSFIERLCLLRQQSECDMSIACSCCLHGLVKIVVFVDKLVELANPGAQVPPIKGESTSIEGIVLAEGIVKFSILELRSILDTYMILIAGEWKLLQPIEVFGRGGPAPGVGVGWGGGGGGLWSKRLLMAEADIGLLFPLLEIFQIEFTTNEEVIFTMQRIVSALSTCVILGPKDGFIMEKALEYLVQVPVLKFFDHCTRLFISRNKGVKPCRWEYNDEDLQLYGKTLASHFKKRWLGVKDKKKKRTVINENKHPLETIHENLESCSMASQDTFCNTLTVEWAHQRLPLPAHWYLSSVSSSYVTDKGHDPIDFIELAKAGLFFILGVEVMTSIFSFEIESPVGSVPLTWKLHSLSVSLLADMGVLEEEKSRNVYQTLQGVYGKLLDELLLNRTKSVIADENEKSSAENGEKGGVEFLMFQSEIHESYSTFVETLAEQFAAVSYGDLIFGRQISVYLLRGVEVPVRLAAWSTLSNAHVLELLPPLEDCLGTAEGYLEPTEADESILEAYVKSWVSGALDRAKTRRSVAFTLVLHQLTSFIFTRSINGKLVVRNKLVTSLLRDYARNQKHEGLMFDLIRYQKNEETKGSSAILSEVDSRFNLLADACGGNSTLLRDLGKLRLSFQKYSPSC